MSDIIKPDFEKLATESDVTDTHDAFLGFQNGCEKVWTDHVEPLLSTVKRLQEDNEQLKTDADKYSEPYYEAKLSFYRLETFKLRTYLQVNQIGKPNQKLFDALYDHLLRLQEDNEQLKAWKESEMSVWRPLLDYFHNEDKCIRLGLSISKEALHRSKEYVRLQEEKKELVEALTSFVEGIDGVGGYEHFAPLINNANRVLKSSELNK